MPDPNLEVAGNIQFAAAATHVIDVASDPTQAGGGLAIRAGHGSDGGTLDLMAGNTLGEGQCGSIGIGRVEGTAHIITIGKLTDPVPTTQTFVRARQLFMDARSYAKVQAPQIALTASSPWGAAEDPPFCRITVGNGVALDCQTNATTLSWNGAQALQAYAGGVILQRQSTGKLAFFDGNPVVKPTVAGSRSDGTALQSLLSALAALNLITNSTVP